ncbi:hypothetical protein PAECIP111890_03748 [Paenibacillus sp. JJ-223]|nr:hypothetical protein PAECIP111890_03748 [Paenibacillus sp. JJ-223]
MSLIHIVPVTKDNWEEAMNIEIIYQLSLKESTF